uniref:Uncharacterized protein n=1 Tax=Clytia hemisphaerica TaxID=252671 RepID=A0A7M5WJU9_9CNID
MNDVRKSMFLSPAATTEYKNKELSISLGNDFQAINSFQRGFDHTGKHFYILEDMDGGNRLRVFIVYFNEHQNALEKRTLTIDFQDMDGSESVWQELDAYTGNVVVIVKHDILDNDNAEKFIINVYHYYLPDVFVDHPYKVLDLTIEPSEADIVLRFDSKDYERCQIWYGLRENGVTALLVLTFFKEYNEEGEATRLRECCLDVIKTQQTEICHSKRVVIDLSQSSVFDDFFFFLNATKERIYFYFQRDSVLRIVEYDYTGNFRYVYSIAIDDGYHDYHFDDRYIVLSHKGITHKDNAIRVWELNQDRTCIVQEFNDEIIDYETSDAKSFSFQYSIKRFVDFLLVANASDFNKGRQLVSWIQICNGEKLRGYGVFRGLPLPNYFLNWNLHEVGITYFDEMTMERQKMFSKSVM